jgi:RNase P/RNase MRP subunit p30
LFTWSTNLYIKELEEKKVNLSIECIDLEAIIASKQNELDVLKKQLKMKMKIKNNVKIELNLKHVMTKSLKSIFSFFENIYI